MKYLLFSISCALLFGLLTACGGGEGSYCKKLQECNVLSGKSVTECTEAFKQCTSNLTSGQRADYNKASSDCNSNSTCSVWAACILQKRQLGIKCL